MRTFDLRLQLSRVTPPVWRLVRVPAAVRLDDLHHAIQAVMGWDDFHPHVFEVADVDYGPVPDEGFDATEDETFRQPSRWAGDDRNVTVAQALKLSPSGFAYIYDFTEEWRVTVEVQSDSDVEDATSVVCLDGEHSGPQQESRDLEPFTVEAANQRLRRALRPRATPERPAGPGASDDQQLLANLSLVVLLLGSRSTRHGTREAWKNIRVEILDSLHEAGLVDSDPQRKSVTITDAGVARARLLLQKLRRL